MFHFTLFGQPQKILNWSVMGIDFISEGMKSALATGLDLNIG